MDPNTVWDELLMDMTVLFDMRNDHGYRVRLEWAGEAEADLVENIATRLESLASWIRLGGALPVLNPDDA